MLNKIKRLLTRAHDETAIQKEHDISLAVTAIMIEIMNVDDKLESAEHQTIITAIKKRFALNDAEVEELIQSAKNAQNIATDFHQFTSLITQHFSTSERIDFLKDLWLIAMVDGTIDPYEEQLIRRIANLIGVYHGEFIQAKIQAREDTTT